MREDVLLNFNKSIVKATVHHNINILDYLLQITHTTDKPVILKDIIRIATREKNIKIIDYAIDQGADSNQAILYATKDFKPILTNFLMAKSEKQELNQIFKNKNNTTQKGLKI